MIGEGRAGQGSKGRVRGKRYDAYRVGTGLGRARRQRQGPRLNRARQGQDRTR